MFQDKPIAEVAESLYDDNLPYHNFGHVRYVLSSAETLLAECINEQIKVDERVVYYSLLFHDAGFQDNHIEKGFDTKEAYSADLAAKVLAENNHPNDLIAQVKQAIICTHFSVSCANNNDKAVKSADLSGLAADYDFFKANAVKLMQEYELLTGNKVEWDTWKKMATEKLALYLREDFSLTSSNPSNSVFVSAAEANIDRLILDDLD